MNSLFLDQWSPLHPERKKQYDRDFLLKLQFANESLLMPLGLPDLPDVILTKVNFFSFPNFILALHFN